MLAPSFCQFYSKTPKKIETRLTPKPGEQLDQINALEVLAEDIGNGAGGLALPFEQQMI